MSVNYGEKKLKEPDEYFSKAFIDMIKIKNYHFFRSWV